MSDNDDGSKVTLSRRKALAGIGTVGAASALGLGGTYAQFTDTEENAIAFTAGGIDGTLEWSGSYNGTDVTGKRDHVSIGETTVVEEGVTVDVHFADIKPGDFGCVNFQMAVDNNPAWVASCLEIGKDIDGYAYEPELEADDDHPEHHPPKGEDGYQYRSDGELDTSIYTIPYYDGDGSCTFFDSDGAKTFDSESYDGSNPSAFWSNAQEYDAEEHDHPDGAGPISVGEADSAEYYLVPRSLRDVVNNVQAVDTAHWNAHDQTLEIENAPDGTSCDRGCIMLDGNGSDNASNNTQGVAALNPDTTLNFGYDFHMPFGVGNEAMGDQLTLKLMFKFLQKRHTEAPDFGSYSPGSNTPN